MGKIKRHVEVNQNIQAKQAGSPNLKKKKRRLLPKKQQRFDKTFDDNEEGKSGLFQLFTDPESYFSKNNKYQKKCRDKEVKQKKAMEIVQKIVSKDFTLDDDDSESSVELLRDASEHHEVQECKTRKPLIDIRRFHQNYKPRRDSPCPPENFPLTDLKSKNSKIIEVEENDDSFISVVEDSDENLTFIASSPSKVLKDYSKRKNNRNVKTTQFVNSTAAQNHSVYQRFDFSQDLSPISSAHEESLSEDRQACEETTPSRQQKTSPPIPEIKKKFVSFPCKSKPASSTRLFDTLIPGLSMTVPDLSSINCNTDTIKEKETESVSDTKNIERTKSEVNNEGGNDIRMKQVSLDGLSNTVISLNVGANRRKALTSTPTNISPSEQAPFSLGVSSISPAEDSDELLPGRKLSHFCESDDIFHSFEFEEVDIPEIGNQGQEYENTDNNQRKGLETEKQQHTNFKIPEVHKPSEGEGDKHVTSIEKKTKHIKSLMGSFLSNKKLYNNPDTNMGPLKSEHTTEKGSVKNGKSVNERKEKCSLHPRNDSSREISGQKKDSSGAIRTSKKINGNKKVPEDRKSSEKVHRKQSRKASSRQRKQKTESKKIYIAGNELSENFQDDDSTVIENTDIPNKVINSTFSKTSEKKSISYRKNSGGSCKNSFTSNTNLENISSNEESDPCKAKSLHSIRNTNPSSSVYLEDSLKTICSNSVHVEPCSYIHTDIEAKSISKPSLENKTNSQRQDEFEAEDNVLESQASKQEIIEITSPDKTNETPAKRKQNTTEDHQISLKKKKDSVIVEDVPKDLEAPISDTNAGDSLSSRSQCSVRVEVRNRQWKKDTCRSNKQPSVRVEHKRWRKKQTLSSKRQLSARVRIKNCRKKWTASIKVRGGVKQGIKNNIGKTRKRISKILTCSLLELRDYFPERLIHQSEEHYVRTGKIFNRRIESAPPDPLCQVLSPPRGICKESCSKKQLYYYYKIDN